MHITSEEVEEYLERKARGYNKEYEGWSTGDKYAYKFGIATAIIWDLIMDLEPDARAKRIKQIKAKA